MKKSLMYRLAAREVVESKRLPSDTIIDIVLELIDREKTALYIEEAERKEREEKQCSETQEKI